MCATEFGAARRRRVRQYSRAAQRRSSCPFGTADVKGDEQKIKSNEYRHVSLAANAEAIAMQTFTEHKVHAIPRHQRREETHYACNCEAKLRPPTRQPAVQRHYVTKQRNQCPRLLWIPSPKSAPGIICPDSTEDCSSSQQQDTELKYAIKPKMHRRVRACDCRIPRVSPKQNMPKTHCQREGRITERDSEHMNG